jgi:hypothetical protein
MNTKISLLLLPALLLSVSPLVAQERQRVSPRDTIKASLEERADITVTYGRPYSKDPKSGEKRKIWGGLVPFGKVWRLGADEATIFTTSQRLDFGGTMLPAGTYSLFLLPEEGGNAKLIINKQTGQWGTRYDESQDLARIDVKQETPKEEVDQFTMSVEANDGGGGLLKIMWEDGQYSAPFKVKR